jgi:hypothetical protein
MDEEALRKGKMAATQSGGVANHKRLSARIEN